MWGSVVFMTPAWKNTRPIPFVSKNPLISFPILGTWLPLTILIAWGLLRSSEDKTADGIKLGITLSVVNVVLDFMVLVLILKAGLSYFVSLTVWLGYVILLAVPWLTGRSLAGISAPGD